MSASTYVGIDVAKQSFDVCVLPLDQTTHHPYNDQGLAELVAKLPEPRHTLVVLESTGGYELDLATALLEHGCQVAVINPARARHFAKSLGTEAKTDRIDARVLARFAQTVPVRTLEKTSENEAKLAALVERRRQVVELRKTEKCRLEHTRVKAARESLLKMIETFDKEIKRLERDIAQLLDSDDHWKKVARILESIPGVGKQTVAVILAELSEIGEVNREQIAALAGVAPYPEDSGAKRGPRHIRGGRPKLRQSLYMAAFNASRTNPVLKAFRDRLQRAGKPFKVIMTACLRKLLAIMNTLVKNETLWNPSYNASSS